MSILSCGTCTRFATFEDLDDLTWLKLDGCIEQHTNTKSAKWLVDVFVTALKKKFRKFLLDGNSILIITLCGRMLGAVSYSVSQSTVEIENISVSAGYGYREVVHALITRMLEKLGEHNCRAITMTVCTEDQYMIDVLRDLHFGVNIANNNSQDEIEYVRYL